MGRSGPDEGTTRGWYGDTVTGTSGRGAGPPPRTRDPAARALNVLLAAKPDLRTAVDGCLPPVPKRMARPGVLSLTLKRTEVLYAGFLVRGCSGQPISLQPTQTPATGPFRTPTPADQSAGVSTGLAAPPRQERCCPPTRTPTPRRGPQGLGGPAAASDPSPLNRYWPQTDANREPSARHGDARPALKKGPPTVTDGPFHAPGTPGHAAASRALAHAEARDAPQARRARTARARRPPAAQLRPTARTRLQQLEAVRARSDHPPPDRATAHPAPAHRHPRPRDQLSGRRPDDRVRPTRARTLWARRLQHASPSLDVHAAVARTRARLASRTGRRGSARPTPEENRTSPLPEGASLPRPDAGGGVPGAKAEPCNALLQPDPPRRTVPFHRGRQPAGSTVHR